jgi:anaerobic dimethyl sulfoxide reductase subunit A
MADCQIFFRMSEQFSELDNKTPEGQEVSPMDRRCFLKLSTMFGAGVLATGGLTSCLGSPDTALGLPQVLPDGTQVVRAGCPAHNCGGRCVLKLFVNEGKIIRVETDDRPVDTLEDPQLRACVRGRSYRRRQYHPDRLKYPMKRVGKRGEGKFERISWDEALDTLQRQIQRVREQYGNSAILVPYGTGSYNQT